MSRPLRRLWPALAISAAIALALLAYSVLAAARDARSGAAPGLFARVGGTLVGAVDDRELRRALPLVDAAYRPGLSPGAAFRRRGLAARALAVAAQSGSATGRARAAHLLAVLALEDAAVDRAHAQRYMAAAVAGFTTAVRFDPHDDASKYDLELLLSLDDKRRRQRPNGGAGAARQRGPGQGHGRAHSGAGLIDAGKGY